MEEIQKYPLLYHKFSTDFNNKYKKQNAWDAIAKTFGSTVKSFEKKYKYIRTSYGRTWRKIKPSQQVLVAKIPESEGLK